MTNSILDLILEPLQYGFMQRSLIIAVLVGLVCSIVGSYLIVRRLALLGDAISHSVLPGLAIAFIFGFNLFLGAFIAGILSTMIITWIWSRSNIKEDAAMGIVFSAFFALGVTLITIVQKENKIDLNHFLFGNILGVTTEEVLETAILAIGVILTVIFLYKELLFYSFDSLGAQAAGLPVNLLNFGLMVLIALTVVASLKAVGVILVLALLITPGATAYLLVTRFYQVMLVGSAIGILSSISGMYLSYYYNLPSGPAIVLVVSSLFTVTLLFSPTQGILTHRQSAGGVASRSSFEESAIWRELKSLLKVKR